MGKVATPGRAYRSAASLLVALLGSAVLWWGSDGFTAFTSETARRLRVLKAPQPLPALFFEDQNGERFRLADYAGKRLAVEFIYTRCATVCYTLGSAFQQLAREAEDDLFLLSISFDPARDTPSELRAYGERFAADGRRWRLARPLLDGDGDDAELHALLDAFGIVVIPDRLGGFEHNAAIHLLAADGRLAAISDPDAASFRRALAAAPPEHAT